MAKQKGTSSAANPTAVQAIVLAAGKGQRMQSDLPKVLHPLLDKPMIFYVISTLLELKCEPVVVVVGYQQQRVRDAVTAHFAPQVAKQTVRFAVQDPPRGTGDAVWTGLTVAELRRLTFIANGDGPLITAATLKKIQGQHLAQASDITMMTFVPPDITGYGRVLLQTSPKKTATTILRVVEEKEATPEQRKIKEGTVGVYLADGAALQSTLQTIMQRPPHNGEYYLTDLAAVGNDAGRQVHRYLASDARECMGINNPQQLAEAEAILKSRLL